MRTRDNAPVGHTCPNIDEMISMLEDLRTSNSALRGWGQENYNELDKAKDRIEDLLDEIKSLETIIQELEEKQND